MFKKRFKKLAVLTASALALFGAVTPTTGVFAEEVDPVYGEVNGLDLIELVDEKPEVAAVPVNNSPNRIAMNLPVDPSTSMSFNWYTTDKMEGSVVRVSTSEDMSDAVEFEAEATEVVSEYAERDENGYYIYASVALNEEGAFDLDENFEPKEVYGYFTDEQITRENTQWTADGHGLGFMQLQEVTEYSYKATATDLEPATKYYFEIGSEEGGFEKGSFTTAGEAGDEVKFIHYTDTQNAYWNANVNNEAAYGANTLEKALEIAPDAAFAIHTGDFVEIAQVEDEWVDNLDMSREANLNLPHSYTPGNHDEYCLRYFGKKDETAFNEHTNVPVTNGNTTGGSYYSYDYNGIHFVVLNTNDNRQSSDNPQGGAIGIEQFNWAKEDIKQARENGANWIVLQYHKPIYSASYHALQDSDVQVIREKLAQMIDELDVDVVLQGHDHNLTRTKSLVYSDENFSYAAVDECEVEEIDGVEYYVNPEGAVYVIPNTSGTKTYDAIYQKGADHVAKVRPRLDWMTDEDCKIWNDLFEIAEQPEDSPKFDHKHDNYRQSEVQNFAVYTVTEDTFLIDFYKVTGDLHGGEERIVELTSSRGIKKQ